jgi:hypothetical protein
MQNATLRAGHRARLRAACPASARQYERERQYERNHEGKAQAEGREGLDIGEAEFRADDADAPQEDDSAGMSRDQSTGEMRE